MIDLWRCVTYSVGKVSGCHLAKEWPVISGSHPSPLNRSAPLPPAGKVRLLCGITFSAKPTPVQGGIVLARSVARLWRMCWLDSLTRTRHHFVKTTTDGGLERH